MIAVAATWLLAAFVALGLGLPVSSRLTHHGVTAVRTALWVGVFATALAVSVVNLLTPLRAPVVALGIVALAVLGTVTSWRRLRGLRWPTSIASRWWVWGGVALGVAGAVGWSAAATRAPSNYDTGLYHLGAIEYATQVATVPGLANLFAPLGYGNVMMPISAAFTNGPLGESGFVAVNCFLLLLLPAELVLRSLGGRQPTIGARVVFVAILAVFPAMLWMADAWVTSPTSDTAVLVLSLIGIAALADVVWRGRCAPVAAVQVLAPLSLAAAMRPQAWLMAALAVLVLIGVQWRADHGVRRLLRTVGPTLFFPVAAVLVGVVRDAVLSGWWMYPLNTFPLPVPWRAEDPSSLLALTLGIARDPGPAYQQAATGYAWIPGWLGRLPSAWEFWVLLVMVVIGLVLLLTHRSSARWRALALTLAPGISASAFWFLVSPPSFRFGWGPLFATAAVILAWGWMVSRWGDRTVIVLGTLSVVAVMAAVLFIRVPTWPEQIPDAATTPLQLDTGLVVQVPATSDQCWGAFPLCTPSPAPGLGLRGMNWRQGFGWGSDAGETG